MPKLDTTPYKPTSIFQIRENAMEIALEHAREAATRYAMNTGNTMLLSTFLEIKSRAYHDAVICGHGARLALLRASFPPVSK